METGRDPSHAHAPSRPIALLSSGCPGLPRSVSPGRPAPIVASDIEHEREPVLVTIEYRIDPKDREPFLAALEKLARETPARRCLLLRCVRGCRRRTRGRWLDESN